MSAVKKSRALYHGKLEYLQYMKLLHSRNSYNTLSRDGTVGDGVLKLKKIPL